MSEDKQPLAEQKIIEFLRKRVSATAKQIYFTLAQYGFTYQQVIHILSILVRRGVLDKISFWKGKYKYNVYFLKA